MAGEGQPGQAPAGWYEDPYGGGGKRFWDGTRWTDQTQPATVPVQPPERAGAGRARIDQLSGKLNTRFMVRKELKKLPEMLHEGEEVLNLAQGRYEGNEGLIAITDWRILFVDEGLVRSHREDFPYERVSSVQSSKGMLSGKVTIYASGNKAQIDNIMPKEQAESIAEHIRNRISAGHQPQAQTAVEAAAPNASESDPLDKLKKLGELRDAGVLSEEEFEEQKAVLLKRL